MNSSINNESPSIQSTEDRLARELREQEEKEEELRLIRQKMGLQTKTEGIETTPILPNIQKVQSPSINENSSSNIIENTLPHLRTSSDSPYLPQKAKAAPLLEEDETDLSRFDVSTNETPIEREIGLAREREEPFRREKGISPQVIKDSNSQQHRLSTGTPPNVKKTNSNQNYKTWGHSRIQNEIQIEQEREENLKHQGRIITTSKDFESDVRKYKEVTPTELENSRKSIGLMNPSKSILKQENSVRKTSDTCRPNIYKSPQNFNSSPRGSIDETPQPMKTSSSMSFEATPPTSMRRSSSENIVKSSKNERIERELREMQEREEELRRQRTALGLYQKINMDEEHYEEIDEREKTSKIVRNEEDLYQNSNSFSPNDGDSAQRARRKHKLEAEWNQKIQQRF